MLVILAVGLLVFRGVPMYGRRTVLVYVTICSLIGSLTVLSCKGLGIALMLTLSGSNQFLYLSTYVLAILCVLCILVQFNYFNRALDCFSTALVTPVYYVFFTSSAIIASVAFFKGFENATVGEVASIVCGFFVIFLGVYLLCSSSTRQAKKESEAPGRLGRAAEALVFSLSKDRLSKMDTQFDVI